MNENTSCAAVNPLNNMHMEERQKPAPSQSVPLSTERVVSSIPKSEFNPDHQSKGCCLCIILLCFVLLASLREKKILIRPRKE
jgi:hypothetical protein